MSSSSPIGAPDDCSLPFFAYGSFRPNLLAYHQIEEQVLRATDATLDGYSLHVRDGLPILIKSGPGVRGTLLEFQSDSAAAYRKVGAFEPKQQYRWEKVQVSLQASRIDAWTLLGRKPGHNVSEEPIYDWTPTHDPSLVNGLSEVRRLARPYVGSIVEFQAWRPFFQMQAVFLLLWSIVERVATFRTGPTGEPHARVVALDSEDGIRAAVVETNAPRSTVYRRLYDSRDPEATPLKIAPDGGGALRYWYQVRSNIAHRGKEMIKDGELLRESLIDLHDVITIALLKWLPDLREAWEADSDSRPLLLRH